MKDSLPLILNNAFLTFDVLFRLCCDLGLQWLSSYQHKFEEGA